MPNMLIKKTPDAFLKLSFLRQIVVARGNVTLSPEAQSASFTVDASGAVERDGAVVLRWGNAATLRVFPAAKRTGFSHGLRDGFVLEYVVPSSLTDMAEVTIDESSSGYWFGGGDARLRLFLSSSMPLVEYVRFVCMRAPRHTAAVFESCSSVAARSR